MTYQAPTCTCGCNLSLISEGTATITGTVKADGTVETVETPSFNRSRAHLVCPVCGNAYAIDLDANFRVCRGKPIKAKVNRDFQNVLYLLAFAALAFFQVLRPSALGMIKDYVFLMAATWLGLSAARMAWEMVRPRVEKLRAYQAVRGICQ